MVVDTVIGEVNSLLLLRIPSSYVLTASSYVLTSGGPGEPGVAVGHIVLVFGGRLLVDGDGAHLQTGCRALTDSSYGFKATSYVLISRSCILAATSYTVAAASCILAATSYAFTVSSDTVTVSSNVLRLG